MEGTDLNWRKSSYSGNGGGECVEIGASADAVVVRDTTDRTGPVLRFTPAAWRRFADRVKQSLASWLKLGLTFRPAEAALVSGEWPLQRPAAVTPRVRHEEIVARYSWHGSWHGAPAQPVQ